MSSVMDVLGSPKSHAGFSTSFAYATRLSIIYIIYIYMLNGIKLCEIFLVISILFGR